MGRTTVARLLGSLVLGASLLSSAAPMAAGIASAATVPHGAGAQPQGIIIEDGAGHGGTRQSGLIDKDKDGSGHAAAPRSGIIVKSTGGFEGASSDGERSRSMIPPPDDGSAVSR
jgi:hypothetical protein